MQPAVTSLRRMDAAQDGDLVLAVMPLIHFIKPSLWREKTLARRDVTRHLHPQADTAEGQDAELAGWWPFKMEMPGSSP